MEDELVALLKSKKGKNICLVNLSGGNHGDTLILMGLSKKLKEIGIDFDLKQQDWRTFDYRYFWKYKKLDYSNYDLTIIRGGGYFNDIWQPGLRFFLDAIKRSKEVVVAPQSYWFRQMVLGDKLKEMNTPVTLFAREKYSYEFLRGSLLPENVDVGLAPDSSFYLSREDLEKYFVNIPKYDVLLCFREDIESRVPLHVKRELEIKNTNSLVEDVALIESFEEYISKVKSSNIIYTDRLHTAILGCIFGKEVYFYPNIYWKSKGVYEYSLAKFNNVKFIEVV